jgi:ABC-type transport system substrate-binding protein
VKKEIFKNYLQKFGDGVLKWNTETTDSNFFTNYMFDSITKSDKNYMFLLNSGRIYPIRQNILNSYLSSVSLDLMKTYDGIRCSDTSFGLFLNRTISYILKDVLTLYTNATNSYSIGKNDVFLNKIQEITYDTNNLYMNGNETINVLMLQRILTLLTDLQKQLVANLTTMD